jgi:hypothetical protein
MYTNKIHCVIQYVDNYEGLLFNAKWAIFQAYHDKTKLHSMRWWCPLWTRPSLSGIFTMLPHINNSLQVDMLLHSDTLFQSLVLLLNVVCFSGEVVNTNVKSLIWQEWSLNRSTVQCLVLKYSWTINDKVC